MKKKISFLLIIILYLFTNKVSSLENKIILKVDNKIITTFNIYQEEKYLIVLNKNLKKINKNKLKVLATDSILKEKIKEIELEKYYKIDSVLDDDNLTDGNLTDGNLTSGNLTSGNLTDGNPISYMDYDTMLKVSGYM